MVLALETSCFEGRMGGRPCPPKKKALTTIHFSSSTKTQRPSDSVVVTPLPVGISIIWFGNCHGRELFKTAIGVFLGVK
jgi:hypothetical protein